MDSEITQEQRDGLREVATFATRKAEGDLSPEAMRVFVKMRENCWQGNLRRLGGAQTVLALLAALTRTEQERYVAGEEAAKHRINTERMEVLSECGLWQDGDTGKFDSSSWYPNNREPETQLYELADKLIALRNAPATAQDAQGDANTEETE